MLSIYLVLVYVFFYAAIESSATTVSLFLLIIALVVVLCGAPIYLIITNALKGLDSVFLFLITVFDMYCAASQHTTNQLIKNLPSSHPKKKKSAK